MSARIAISEAYRRNGKNKTKAVKSKNKRLDEIESVIKTLELVEQNLIGAYAAQFAFMYELSSLVSSNSVNKR